MASFIYDFIRQYWRESCIVVACILALVSYKPFAASIRSGKKPAISTRCMLVVVHAMIIAGLAQQPGGFALVKLCFMLAIMCGNGYIAYLALKHGKRSFFWWDLACAGFLALAFLAWCVVSDPLVGLVLVLAGNLVAWFPAFKNVLLTPENESPVPYMWVGPGAVLQFIAVAKWSTASADLAQMAMPGLYMCIAGLMIMLIKMRRRPQFFLKFAQA